MENKAVQHAERYGILDYTIKGSYMVYYASYPSSGQDKRTTYKVTINLETNEEKREQLKRYYKKGETNLYL